MSQFPHDRDHMLEASREQQMKALSQQQIRFRAFISSIPILGTYLSVDQFTALSFLFEGRVYPTHSVILSKSAMCDRVIILTKGAVKFNDCKDEWGIGESVGYTCLLPHRWALTAIAIEQCECIELSRKFLEAFLHDIGKYEEAKKISEALLYPNRFEAEVREEIWRANGVHVTKELIERHRSGKLLPQAGRASSTESPVDHSVSVSVGRSLVLSPVSSGGILPPHQGNPSSVLSAMRSAVEHTLRQIEGMRTPIVHPISTVMDYKQLEPGFAPALPKFDVTELAVPGGLFVPRMSQEDKQVALTTAAFNHKRDPVRRVTRVTPFLIVKQR
jgi:hypothetical protein